MQFTDLEVENTPLPTINRVKRPKHVIRQIRLYCNGPTREEFKYCMEAPEEGCALSFQLEKNIFFKSRCKNLLFNFESILTLKSPGFSDFGTARGGDGICFHL